MLSSRIMRHLCRGSTIPIWSNSHSNNNNNNNSSQHLLKAILPSPLLVSDNLCMVNRVTVACYSTDIEHPPPPQLPVENASHIRMTVEHGLPQITVPLPSRKDEACIFTLKPVTHSVGDFLIMLRNEDAGIDRVIVRTVPGGIRVSSTTSIQTLLKSPFELTVNDNVFRVEPPPQKQLEDGSGELTLEEMQRLGDIRSLVGQLYEALHVDEFHAEQERQLVSELEELKRQISPLEEQRKLLSIQAEKRTNQITWLGLGMMSVQFGILARLTWWEYSWDIMEPVTYFVTYGTAMACYAYFVLTKQDYLLPDVRDRQFLLSFHRKAKKDFWDVNEYNKLKDGIMRLEGDIRRLREPFKLKMTHGLKPSLDKDGLLGSQINIGNIRNMLKGKLG